MKLPLTYDQLTLLETGHDEPTFALYLELDGPLVEDAFSTALRQTLSECGCLRVAFGGSGLELRQSTGTGHVSGPEVIDASASSDADTLVAAWIGRELDRTMDVNTGPLYVHTLFRLPHGRFGWFQRYHRLVNDEPGMAAIVRATAETYEAARTAPPRRANWPFTSPSALLASDARYRESAAWLDDRRYWEELLAGVPEAEELFDQVPEQKDSRYENVSVGGVAARLARRSGGGTAAVLLAALALYRQSLTGVDDVLLGFREHGTTMPVRVTLAPHFTFDAVTRQVGLQLRRSRRRRFLSTTDAAAIGQDWCPLAGEVREPLGVERIGNYAVTVVKRWGATGERASFAVDDRDGTWSVEAHGPADLQRFVRILTAALESPHGLLAGVEVLSAEECGVLVPVRGGRGVGVRVLPEILAGGVGVDRGAVAVSCCPLYTSPSPRDQQ
ncbi:condensation domain-containing protein, partial [Rhodococcus oxybenzonivorans]|uniref:condensation domain-containing protein n=1 Tax=Rhodococcus oxybenzonivorans TaxID=1990687 RepID=UPI0029543822